MSLLDIKFETDTSDFELSKRFQRRACEQHEGECEFCTQAYGATYLDLEAFDFRNVLKGEVHDFYKTSWFKEFEALSRMMEVRGSCAKPFKRLQRYSTES